MISQGLTALSWTAPGSRGTIPGCTNPFWVAVNTFLRAIGMIDADAATQETYFDVNVAVAAAATADELVPGLFGTILTPIPSDPTTDVCYAGYGQTGFSMAQVPLSAPTVTMKANGSGDPVSKTVSVSPDTSGDFVWTPGFTIITANCAINQSDEVDITYQYASGLFTSTTPSERQFRFKGTVDGSKPTRDWLRDILNNALGYFTWTFGKLKLGSRNTATPVSTFKAGNILFNTLHLGPIKPGFEKLTVDFADEEYLFAHNTVCYVDQDYAARRNRVQNPRAAEFGLVGCSTKSQATRLAVCRAREELGGVGETEQTAARRATWRSTILALDTDAGSVVSIIDPEVNSGAGAAFRVQRWRLNRDWSVDLIGNTVTPSMYDLTAGRCRPTVTAQVQPNPGARDSGPPPTPAFSARVCPTDSASIEIYNLTLAQAANTRTITTAAFTLSFAGGDAAPPPLVAVASFPPDFFPNGSAAGWTFRIFIPGHEVIGVAGVVTNTYGSSSAYTATVDLTTSNPATHSSRGTLAPGGSLGHGVVLDADGNLQDAGASPALDGGGAKTLGHVAVYDAYGRLVDGSGAPILDSGGAKTSGHAAVFDANSKLTDGGAAPLYDGGGAKTSGHAAVFDANSRAVDGGAAPVLDGGGAKTSGHVPTYDANGKLVDAGAAPILDSGSAKTAGHAAVFDSNSKLADAGAAPILDGGGAKTAAHAAVFDCERSCRRWRRSSPVRRRRREDAGRRPARGRERPRRRMAAPASGRWDS